MFCKAESRTRGVDYQLKQVPDKRLFRIDRKREEAGGKGDYGDKVEVSPGEIHVPFHIFLLPKQTKLQKRGEMRRGNCEE